FFFFSSRRRHTRSKRDWSSDVCSSDLTLREASEKDFAGTLRRVAEMGYDGVELAGYGGLTALEVREVLDTYGLRAAACHVPLHEIGRASCRGRVSSLGGVEGMSEELVR